MSTYCPNEGDLVKVSFSPQKGHEQAGWRPAIVLSPKPFNRITGFAWVCPITSHKKGYPFEVDLPENRDTHGVILTDQIKSFDWRARHFRFIESADVQTVKNCKELIHTVLF